MFEQAICGLYYHDVFYGSERFTFEIDIVIL